MRHIILLIITLLTCACATVSSNYQNKEELEETSPDKIQGLLYFLPKRLVTLTATQKPVTAKTVTDSQQNLTKATTAVNEAKEAAKKVRKDFADAQASFPNPNGASEVHYIEHMAKLDISLKIKETILSKAETKRDQAAASMAEAKAAHAAGIPIYKIKLEISAPEPDANFAFRADYRHNWLRDDEFSLTINNRGLLSSSNVTATDQTSQILAELAGASAAFGTKLPELTLAIQNQPKNFMAMKKDEDDDPKKLIEIVKVSTCDFPTDQPHQYQMSFDPTDETLFDQVNKELAKCFPFQIDMKSPTKLGPAYNNSGLNINLENVKGLVYRPALPHVLTVKQCTSDFTTLGPNNQKAFIACNVPESDDEFEQIQQRGAIAESVKTSLADSLAEIEKLAGKNGGCNEAEKKSNHICHWKKQTETLIEALDIWFSLANDSDYDLDPTKNQLISPALGKILTADLPKEKTAKSAAQDVLRIANELRVTILPDNASNREMDPVQSTIVMLPNNAPLSIIPMKSSAFVSSVHDVTFENGLVTQWGRNAPSEVLEIVRLPVKILSSILEVPAQIFQLRVNLSDDQSALINAQRSQMESQLALQVLQGCIEKAQLGKIDMSECLPSE